MSIQRYSESYYEAFEDEEGDFVKFEDHERELAALREELATLKTKHERTESALNGSMRALTRVDNMWKKRWLDKTGEPAMSLVVDDEFKALFEEIKDYRKRLTAAEQRNAALVKAATAFMEYAESGWDHFPDVGVNLKAALKPESGASE